MLLKQPPKKSDWLIIAFSDYPVLIWVVKQLNTSNFELEKYLVIKKKIIHGCYICDKSLSSSSASACVK